jgi:hypothetical protein
MIAVFDYGYLWLRQSLVTAVFGYGSPWLRQSLVTAVLGDCHLPVAIFQAPYGRWTCAHVFVLICQRL